MTEQRKGERIYRARPDLGGNRLAALRTSDPKVVRLITPPRRIHRQDEITPIAKVRAA